MLARQGNEFDILTGERHRLPRHRWILTSDVSSGERPSAKRDQEFALSDGDLISSLSFSDIGKSRLRLRGGIGDSNHLA
jgi:hypothetical protein